MFYHFTGLVLLLAASSVAAALGYDDTASSLACEPREGKYALLRLTDGATLGTHTTEAECGEVKAAAHGGVACVWFTASMPVGPGGWQENGWRPTNITTRMGLGRKPLASLTECLEATRHANGGVVCTNTGVGAKAANIQTNLWCGASSQLSYCFKATARANDFVVCSFPSGGTGAEAGWVRTRVTTECDYQGNKQTLAECSATIP